jgi:nucleotide-binding universal stress UspA family protein
MLRFGSILCGVDFSDHSAQAARCAAAMAARHQAALTAITVLDPFLIEAAAVAYDMEKLTADTRADLAAFVSEALVSEPTQPPPALKVVTGRAPREILRAAETLKADVIVLGTHGLGGIKKAFFGSTTDRVLRDGGFPVLVVPFVEGAPPLNPLAQPRTFVAAVALDRDAGALVQGAASLARDFQSTLTLVHVLEPLQLPPRLRRPLTHEDAARQARAERQVAELAASVAGVIDVTTEVRWGEPAAQIATAADPDSVIVIGLGHPRGVGHRPGSTAYRLVCCARVPVLALPEPGD